MHAARRKDAESPNDRHSSAMTKRIMRLAWDVAVCNERVSPASHTVLLRPFFLCFAMRADDIAKTRS